MRLPPWVARAGLRLRPRLPDPLWQGLLELGSMVTDTPTIGLPAFRRAVVIAPHPDDETIGCGGTIALLAESGAEVNVVVASDGEATIGARLSASTIARRRRAEAEAACRALGAAPPRFLGLPDGGLTRHGRELTATLQDVLDEVDPEVVLTPWLLDGHPDHRAVTLALARCTAAHAPQVWGYETHTPLVATRLVPVDRTVERKLAALRLHETAGEAFDLEATLALNRWRSLATTGGRGHAEAFHAVAWDDLGRLAALPSLRRPA